MKVNFRYEQTYNSEYKQRIQETVEYILERKYGETISNSDLAKKLHYNIENEDEFKKYKSTMSRVKNFLINYGYILKSISGLGYYIMKPKQISGYCYRTYIVKTQRLLDKSELILNHIDTTELSEDRLNERKDVMELNKSVAENIEGTIVASNYYSRKNYYNNLND